MKPRGSCKNRPWTVNRVYIYDVTRMQLLISWKGERFVPYLRSDTLYSKRLWIQRTSGMCTPRSATAGLSLKRSNSTLCVWLNSLRVWGVRLFTHYATENLNVCKIRYTAGLMYFALLWRSRNKEKLNNAGLKTFSFVFLSVSYIAIALSFSLD